ncbi:hypothetical protein [Nostoc sp. PCC 9305]|uniref:hypothetical protein n=1 Tax=Nostoc sp. PCC 9305 TaxID=296636 RepID=UPI0039C6B981
MSKSIEKLFARLTQLLIKILPTIGLGIIAILYIFVIIVTQLFAIARLGFYQTRYHFY